MQNMRLTEERLAVMRVEGYLDGIEDRRDFRLLVEMNGLSCAAKQIRRLRSIELEVKSLESWRARASRMSKTKRQDQIDKLRARRAESARIPSNKV